MYFNLGIYIVQYLQKIVERLLMKLLKLVLGVLFAKGD